MDAVLSCMVEDRYGNAAACRDLIEYYKESLGVASGVLLRSYQMVISMALESLTLNEGDGIVLSPFAHRYYYDVIIAKGFTPIVVDVQGGSPLMDLEKLSPQDLDRAKAVVVEHKLGWVYDLDSIKELGLTVIEDITDAFGGGRQDSPVGTLGDLVIHRYEENDPIVSAGGSALLARQKKLVSAVKVLLSDWDIDVYLSDLSAAMILPQLKDMETRRAQNKELYRHFVNALRRGGNQTFIASEDRPIAYSYLPVMCGGSVKDIIQFARKKNIDTEMAFNNTLLERIDNTKDLYPVAHDMALRTLLFPLYGNIKKENIDLETKILASLP